MSVELLLMLDALHLEIRAASYLAAAHSLKDKGLADSATQTGRQATEEADSATNLARYREGLAK